MPGPLAGLDVEGDDARAEQPVARTEAAVEVNRRRIRRHVDEPPFRVGGDGRPGRDVARPLPRVVLPRLVPELAGARNDVELPLVLAGPRVVAEDVARHVLDAGLVVALLGRVADHHHAVHHDRRRRAGDVAQLARDAEVGIVGAVPALPGSPVGDQVRQHVDHTGLRETGERHRAAPVLQRPARLRVERVEEEGRTDDVDDPAAVHLGVGHTLPVAVAHPAVEAGGVRLAVGPERLAGGRIDRHHVAALAGNRIEDAVDVDRSRARHAEHARAVVVATPDPRHLEVLEVVGGDLIQARVAGVPGVAADVAPFAGRRFIPLRAGRGRHQQHNAGGADRNRGRGRGRGEKTERIPDACKPFHGASTISIPRSSRRLAGSSASPAG